MSKRSDGRIEKTVTINGRRIHVYGYTDREIREKIDELYDEKYLGITSDVTFSEYAEHWLDVALVGKKESTITSYTRAINHLIDLLGNLRMADMKRSEIEDALNTYIDKPEMRNKMLQRISAIFDMAIDDEICSYNPAKNIKPLKHERTVRERFTAAETEAFQKAELPEDLRLMLDILYYTGMRRGELLGLSRKEIKDGFIHICEQSQFDRKGSPFITTPKTRGSVRDVPIPPNLQKEIRSYLRHNDSVYMFEPYRTKHSFTTAWMKIQIALVQVHRPNFIVNRSLRDMKMGDIPCRITPHVLRHNYASILHDKGVDVVVAKELLGHSSISTTLDIYTHLDNEKKEDRFEKVRDIFQAI